MRGARDPTAGVIGSLKEQWIKTATARFSVVVVVSEQARILARSTQPEPTPFQPAKDNPWGSARMWAGQGALCRHP